MLLLLGSLGLFYCVPNLRDIPCVRDGNCPSGEICGNEGVCVENYSHANWTATGGGSDASGGVPPLPLVVGMVVELPVPAVASGRRVEGGSEQEDRSHR